MTDLLRVYMYATTAIRSYRTLLKAVSEGLLPPPSYVKIAPFLTALGDDVEALEALLAGLKIPGTPEHAAEKHALARERAKKRRDSYVLMFEEHPSGKTYFVRGWDEIIKRSGLKKSSLKAYLNPSARVKPTFRYWPDPEVSTEQQTVTIRRLTPEEAATVVRHDWDGTPLPPPPPIPANGGKTPPGAF